MEGVWVFIYHDTQLPDEPPIVRGAKRQSIRIFSDECMLAQTVTLQHQHDRTNICHKMVIPADVLADDSYQTTATVSGLLQREP